MKAPSIDRKTSTKGQALNHTKTCESMSRIHKKNIKLSNFLFKIISYSCLLLTLIYDQHTQSWGTDSSITLMLIAAIDTDSFD